MSDRYHFTGGSMHHEDDCTLYCPLNGFRDSYGAFAGMPVSVTLVAENEAPSDSTDQTDRVAELESRYPEVTATRKETT